MPAPLPLPPEDQPPRTVPDVVTLLQAGLSWVAACRDDPVFAFRPLEGTDDSGRKQRNAIEVRFATGEGFLVMVTPLPMED